MDILSAVTSCFIDSFKRCILRRVKEYYVTAKKCEDNLKALEEQITKLDEERVAVQDMVLEAESYMRVAREDVTKWLEAVANWMEGEKNRLENDRKRANEKLCCKWCPNVKTRHKLSKKAVEDKSKVEAFIEGASKYKTIAGVSVTRQQGPTKQGVPSNNKAMSSRKDIVERVVQALKAPDINKVGVYGIGGIGKTVLAKEVRDRVLKEKIFNEVVMCPLPRKPSIRKIQQMIIDDLGLYMDEEKESVVATRLLDKLKKKNVLVVLDNLWKPLDLRDVGIPIIIRDQDIGCKILLISRELDVLSENGMNCQENILVPPLSEEEAQKLFKRIAGYSYINDEALNSKATETVRDCAGLPVFIVAAAKCSKKWPLHVWKSARRKMIENIVKQEECSSIEMSYKFLESKELQSAFVLCSQMANKCSIRDFLKFAIALDVFDKFLSVEEAQFEVRSYVLKLQEASLLRGTDSREEIVIQDDVREVGQSIASRDYQAYTRSQEAELKRWPPKDVKRICLYCDIVTLRKRLNYPELEFLVIDGKDCKLEIKDLNLKTKKLKVLALYRCFFKSLPSLKGPNSLVTLCLDGSALEGAKIDTIGELQNLEILSFVKSDIERLPEKLGELSKLRILDLSDCSRLEVIPPNFISRLTSLEELYIGNSFRKWEKQGGGQSTASLAELKKLSRLTNLEIHIPDAGMMPEDLFPGKLERYRVTIGSRWKRWAPGYEGMRRLLKLKLDTSILMESSGVRKLVRRAEALHLEELKGVEDSLHQLDGEGFQELKHLTVSSNSKIKYIVNGRKCSSSFFPQLECLILNKLESLEKIFDGNLRGRPLCNLKDLRVGRCKALKNLLSITTAQKLLNLESITVKQCEILEEFVSGEGDHSDQDKQAYENAFFKLRSLDLYDLPKLRNFYAKDKKQPEEISSPKIPVTFFNGKIVFSKLEVLTLRSASNIERLWHGDPQAIVSSIKNLKRLTVENCNELKYLFTSSMVSSLEKLQYLSVRDCDGIEEIIIEGKRSGKMELPMLSTLQLDNLKILKRFCIGLRIHCPMLKVLCIESCKKLETFIAQSQKRCPLKFSLPKFCDESQPEENLQPLFDEKVSFPRLEEMTLSNMNNVEIWHKQFPDSSFCDLKKLTVTDCGNLQRVFPSNTVERFKRLDKLVIIDCNSVVVIFELPEKIKEGNKEEQFQLRGISLVNLPKLKSIWQRDPMGVIILENLQSIKAVKCPNLKNIFFSSIAERLEKLEELKIIDCEGLEDIIGRKEKEGDGKLANEEHIKFCCPILNSVAKEGNGKLANEDVPDFWFPSLTSVTLSILPNLRSFYPEQCMVDYPSLKYEELKDCGREKFSKLEDLIRVRLPRTEIGELPSSSVEKDPCTQHTTLNKKVTEVSDAESDHVPRVRKIIGKEDSTLPETKAETVRQAPSGEIEMVGSVPTTSNFPAQEPPTRDESTVPFAESSSEKQGRSGEVDQPTLSDDSQDKGTQPSPQTLFIDQGVCLKCHGVPQSELPILTRQATSDVETVLAKEDKVHKEAPSEDQDLQDASIPPKIAQNASAQGSSHVIADDMADARFCEKSPTSKDMENPIPPHLQDNA